MNPTFVNEDDGRLQIDILKQKFSNMINNSIRTSIEDVQRIVNNFGTAGLIVPQVQVELFQHQRQRHDNLLLLLGGLESKGIELIAGIEISKIKSVIV